jgi:hypothetical protein
MQVLNEMSWAARASSSIKHLYYRRYPPVEDPASVFISEFLIMETWFF